MYHFLLLFPRFSSAKYIGCQKIVVGSESALEILGHKTRRACEDIPRLGTRVSRCVRVLYRPPARPLAAFPAPRLMFHVMTNSSLVELALALAPPRTKTKTKQSPLSASFLPFACNSLDSPITTTCIKNITLSIAVALANMAPLPDSPTLPPRVPPKDNFVTPVRSASKKSDSSSAAVKGLKMHEGMRYHFYLYNTHLLAVTLVVLLFLDNFFLTFNSTGCQKCEGKRRYVPSSRSPQLSLQP